MDLLVGLLLVAIIAPTLAFGLMSGMAWIARPRAVRAPAPSAVASPAPNAASPPHAQMLAELMAGLLQPPVPVAPEAPAAPARREAPSTPSAFNPYKGG